MANLRFESPLVWPDWIPATPRASQRNDHGLTAQPSLTESINFLEQELKDIGATGTLYLDIEHPLNDRLRKKVGSRTGACLQVRWQDKDYVLACDRWLMMEHNIYMLHLAIRQWRNIDRWGIAGMDVLLKGFETGAVLSPSGTEGEVPAWMRALGLGHTSTLDDAIAVYHRRAKQAAHDTDALARLNNLMEEARAYFSARKI